MKSLRGIAGVAAIVAVIAGCGSPDVTQPVGPTVPLVRLRADPYSFSSYSGFEAPTRLVVRDAATWAAVWQQIYDRETPVPPLPAIDFSREMIVVAALGSRGTGGYSILLEGATETADGTAVTVKSTSPGSTCLVTEALTQPIDVARLPLRSGSVTFIEQTHVAKC